MEDGQRPLAGRLGSVDTTDCAVQVVGLNKSYGSGRSKNHVLQDLNLSAPRGAIYGLLGPSGCGKTTLLRCIVGRLRIDGGEVSTLGRRPGSVGHHVPGKMVGYMPQELALFEDFSIQETINYFGRLHKMKMDYVKKRIEFLLDFLALPAKTSIIAQLSGGQKRRTSFAVALLQEPELLILDEPTVGVDPLLRQRIWEHLLSLARQGNITIIITTHYVEEARQAHMVGMMRSGRLLAEAPPGDLLLKHSLDSLEDVFLLLCQKDQADETKTVVQSVQSVQSVHNSTASTQMPVYSTSHRGEGSPEERRSLLSDPGHRDQQLSTDVTFDEMEPSSCQKCCKYTPDIRNVGALCIKNLTMFKRKLGLLLFEFLLPSFQIVFFCLCIGREPYGLDIAVVNNETFPCPGQGDNNLGCLYLQEISNHTINQVVYNQSFDDALDAVKAGKQWGIIEIGSNFSTDLKKRFTSPIVDNKTLEGSTVRVHLDMTNQQISITMQLEITNAFQTFLAKELAKFGLNPAFAEIPVKFEEPIYGSLKPSFTDFMAPGIIISITFFMATGLTALAFVLERKQGLLDRSYVAGVNSVEVMLGHIATQSLVMSVQVILLLVFALALFQVNMEGSIILVFLLTLFEGLTGMALGLLISGVCDDETSAIQCALGSVYPNMLISGIIWPIESMPQWLRYISYCLPMTYGAEAMRCIQARGWGLLHMPVWRGFLMTIGWGWLLMAISAIILVMKRD